jgi:hypothetical protein
VPVDSTEAASAGLSEEAAAALTYSARTFMEAYAQDIRSGDGPAVAARYHPEGAYFNGGVMSAADILSSYSEGWEGPTSFSWRSLNFEVLGPAAVLATGTGLWGQADGEETMDVLYASLLVRSEGEWKIRVEDETVVNE